MNKTLKLIGVIGLTLILWSCGGDTTINRGSETKEVKKQLVEYEKVGEKTDLSMNVNHKLIYYYTKDKNWGKMYDFVKTIDYKLDGFYYIVFVTDKNVEFPKGRLSGLGFSEKQSKNIVSIYKKGTLNDYSDFTTYEKNSWDSPSVEYPNK